MKDTSYEEARIKICQTIVDLYNKYAFLAKGDLLEQNEKEYYRRVSIEMRDSEITVSLRRISDYLCRYYGKR